MGDKNHPPNKKPGAVMMAGNSPEGNAEINNGATREDLGSTDRATTESRSASLDGCVLPYPAYMVADQGSLLSRAPQPTTQLLQLLNPSSDHPSTSLLAGLPSATSVLQPLSLKQVSLLGQLESVLLAKQAAGLFRPVPHVPTVQALAAAQINQGLYSPPAQATLALPNSLSAQLLSAAQNMAPDSQSQLLKRLQDPVSNVQAVQDPDSNAHDQSHLLRSLLDPNSNSQAKSQVLQGLIQEIAEVDQLERLVSQQQAGLAAQGQRKAHLLQQLLLSQTQSSLPVTAQDQSQLPQRLIIENSIKDRILSRVLAHQPTASAERLAGDGRRGAGAPPPLPQIFLSQTSLHGACSVSSGSISSGCTGGVTPKPESESESKPPAPSLPDGLGVNPTENGDIDGRNLAAPGSPHADHAVAADPGRLLPIPPHEDRGSKRVPDRRTSSSSKKRAPRKQKRLKQAGQDMDSHPPALRAKPQKQQENRCATSAITTRMVRRQYSPSQLDEALNNLAESMRRSAESRGHVMAMRGMLTPKQRRALSSARDRLRQENEWVKRSFLGARAWG